MERAVRFDGLALFLALALFVAAPARAGCGDPLPGPGTPIAIAEVLPEPDRQALSAAIYLALSDDGGLTDRPWRDIEAAPPCPLSTIDDDGVTWRVSGGEGSAPLRWARATGVDLYYFLVQGPNLEESKAWLQTRRPGAAGGQSATFLVGTEGGLQYVLKMYEGAPDARRLAADLAEAISGRTVPFAAFDPTGNAVTVRNNTASGIRSELFRPLMLGPNRPAILLGPDGHFFSPVPGGVRLRGAEIICADAYGPFARGRTTVISPNDEALDLSCSLNSEESWITIFSTHMADDSGDKALFRSTIGATQSQTGVKRRPVESRPARGGLMRAGAIWVDRNDMGQGQWFIRRGEYVIEVRATFRLDETDAVYDLLAAVLRNEVPPAPASEPAEPLG